MRFGKHLRGRREAGDSVQGTGEAVSKLQLAPRHYREAGENLSGDHNEGGITAWWTTDVKMDAQAGGKAVFGFMNHSQRERE
jgi:hypothetical protein